MLLTWNVWNCIQWLEMDFLNYLDKWDTSVQSRPDFTLAEMKKMKLSDETFEGLEVTGMTTYIYNYYGIKPFILNCFISCSDIIIICWNGKIHRQPGVKFLLSKWFCQDTFEVFFGHQRAKGGWNSETILWCNGSLRVQSSAALDPIRGNCRKRPADKFIHVSEAPLPKRKRGSKWYQCGMIVITLLVGEKLCCVM